MENNKSDVHWVFIVLRAAGIILSLVGILFGVLFVLHGNWVFSIVLAIVLVAPLAIISEVLKKLKIKERKSYYYKPEYIFGSFYALFFIVALFFFAHYWNIELGKKDKLTSIGKNRLEEIKTMRQSYLDFVDNKKKSYNDEVETNTDNLFLSRQKNDIIRYQQVLDNLLGEGIDYSEYMNSQDDTTIKNTLLKVIGQRKKDKIAKLNGNYDLGQAKIDFDAFYKNASNVFEKWKTFELSKTFFEIDNEYDKLLKLAKHRSNNEFSYKNLEKCDFRIDNPFDISANFIIALAIFALLNLAILSVYIKIERYIIDTKKSESELEPETF